MISQSFIGCSHSYMSNRHRNNRIHCTLQGLVPNKTILYNNHQQQVDNY